METKFALTIFPSRKVPRGKVQSFLWHSIVEMFRRPTITDESVSEYELMSNEQKTEVKDVGGYVAGELKAGRRSKAALVNRCILTVDADHAAEPDPEKYLGDLRALSLNFILHSTHSSTPEAPRFRVLVPLSRPVNAAEYRYLVNLICSWMGEEGIDDTTDQAERLMFWPSVSFDGDYIFVAEEGGDFMHPEEFLPETLPDEPVRERKPVEGGVLEVGEGQRNKTVFEFAATLRGKGLDQAGIREMLEQYNDRYCTPPLEGFELDTICRSVCSHYNPGEAVSTLRDAWDDFNDLGEWKDSKPAPIKQLTAESLASLSGRHVDAPVYVVDNMIANGITILASPPKFGKSWMCMDLAISVANGTEFMGVNTHKRGVIYLALEDGDYRLQERGRKVAGDRPLPSNLYLVKEAPVLADGLLPMLKTLADECGDVGMVIIDTLQKVRGVAGRTEGVYGYD